MSRVPYRSIFAVALIALALPASAQAGAYDVIRDCADNGRLDGNYSNAELKQAREKLPSDIDEYSDCREVINGAITSGSDRGGGRDTGGGSGGSATSAQEREAARARDAAALDDATGRGKPTLAVAGENVSPGDNGLFDLASARNGLPLPLLLALILVALMAAGGGLVALSRRFPGLAERIPLLSKISLPRVPIPGLRR